MWDSRVKNVGDEVVSDGVFKGGKVMAIDADVPLQKLPFLL